MRILLINPFYPFSEHPTPPLGLLYIAAKLEQDGHEVRLLDLLATPDFQSKLQHALEDAKPQAVGSTSVTMNFHVASGILQECKRIDPQIVTLIGGPHVTFTAEETLLTHPHIDIISRGESEETVSELFAALEDGKDIGTIKGISFRDQGNIISTESRPLILDLDALPPPAHHLIPLSKYKALDTAFPVLTGRGCPGQCIFCVGRKMIGAKGRFRKPELVVDEIEQILALGFTRINFADDLFTYSKNHVKAICQEIHRRKLKFNWTAFARVDTVDEGLLGEMKNAGCTFLCFGVETANEEILRQVKKRINLSQVQKAIKICRQIGIESFASFILGLPGETKSTIQQTVRFAKELETYYGFHLLSPFPGTEIRERSKEYGLTILTNDWSKYDADEAIVETGGVGKDGLSEAIGEYNRQVGLYVHYLEATKDLPASQYKEKEKLEQKKTKQFIWDLLMANIIDKVETCSESSDYHSHLDLLVENINLKLNYPTESIKTNMESFLSQNLIKPAITGHKIRWLWNHEGLFEYHGWPIKKKI